MKITQIELEPIIISAVEACSCQFWGMEFLSGNNPKTLRIYIDKEMGVDIDACVLVSHQIKSLLSVEKPIDGEYNLEVSSPGLNRPLFDLAHYQKSIGMTLNLKLATAIKGRRRFTGVLNKVRIKEIIIEIDQIEHILPFEYIEKANIVPQF